LVLLAAGWYWLLAGAGYCLLVMLVLLPFVYILP
jgi:hypothetical protein